MGHQHEVKCDTTLRVKDDFWRFYKDTRSGCFVARRDGDEHRPYVAADWADLQHRIKLLYPLNTKFTWSYKREIR